MVCPNPGFPKEPVICNTHLYRAKGFSGFVYHVIAACTVYSSHVTRHLKVNSAGGEAAPWSQWCPRLLRLSALPSLTVASILLVTIWMVMFSIRFLSQFQAKVREKSGGQVYPRLSPMATLTCKGVWEDRDFSSLPCSTKLRFC